MTELSLFVQHRFYTVFTERGIRVFNRLKSLPKCKVWILKWDLGFPLTLREFSSSGRTSTFRGEFKYFQMSYLTTHFVYLSWGRHFPERKGQERLLPIDLSILLE